MAGVFLLRYMYLWSKKNLFRSLKLLFRKLLRKFAMETSIQIRLAFVSIALTTNHFNFCVIIIVWTNTSVLLKILVVLNLSTTMEMMQKRTNDWIVAIKVSLLCNAMTQSFLSCVLFLTVSASFIGFLLCFLYKAYEV